MSVHNDKYLDAAQGAITVLAARKGFDNWWDDIDEFHEEILEEIQNQLALELGS